MVPDGGIVVPPERLLSLARVGVLVVPVKEGEGGGGLGESFMLEPEHI